MPDGLHKYSVRTDMQYGARTIGVESMSMIPTEPVKTLFTNPSLYFDGIPIKTSLLCVSLTTHTKKWKRLNRPAKTKTKESSIPAMFMCEPPMVPRTTILCHPKLFKRMANIFERQNR